MTRGSHMGATDSAEKVTTESVRRYLLIRVLRNRGSTNTELRNDLPTSRNVWVSVATVRQFIYEVELTRELPTHCCLPSLANYNDYVSLWNARIGPSTTGRVFFQAKQGYVWNLKMVVIEFGLDVVNVIVHATSRQRSSLQLGLKCSWTVFFDTCNILVSEVTEYIKIPETQTGPYYRLCFVHGEPLPLTAQ